MMNRLTLAFLIVAVSGLPGYSQCAYFRVSAKLLRCGAADTKALDALNPYQPVSDAPELADASTRDLIDVHCDCEYSLQGSDPRCDLDQTVEKSSVLGADDATHSCRRGNLLCHDVCPALLP
jgi:hypothetical protein